MYVIALVRYKAEEAVLAQHNAEHREYLRPYKQSGKIVMAGPFYPPGSDDRSGGVILFNAETAEEVASIMAGDPFNKRGFYDLELLEWRTTLGKELLAEMVQRLSAG